MKIQIKLFIVLSFVSCNCTTNQFSKLDFLEGTWKTENKEQYEVWEKNSSNQLKGVVYKYENGQQIVLEHLFIKPTKNGIVYEATVGNQNQGKAIRFVLSSNATDFFSFENKAHDFPKKIQYKKINDQELFIQVTGDKGKGFSYKMHRENSDVAE